jgi:LysR family hydrogen peroxide-inducible transcriptional activator
MNLSGLSLRDLEYVVAIADEGHFGRAAERCNVSQPTLSVQVRKLENALGLALFERSNRGVLLTMAGQAIVRQARVVLAEAQRLLALAVEGRGSPLTGRLVLAAIQTLGPYFFPLILRLLRQEFPLLTLALSEARTAEILDGLRDGRIDAALVSLPVATSGLTLSPLFVEPFRLACPADHPLAQGAPPRAEAVGGPDLLLLDEGNCLRDHRGLRGAPRRGPPRHQPGDPALDGGGGGRLHPDPGPGRALGSRSERADRDPPFRGGGARPHGGSGLALQRSPGGRARPSGRVLPHPCPGEHAGVSRG